VTFLNGGASGTSISGCTNLPVVLISPSDSKTGTATCSWTVDLGNATSQTYIVGTKVDGYYTRLASADNTDVTVSLSLNNTITGGGYVVTQHSSGSNPGDPGSKANFGFNVKYNKSGTNLQGSINLIVRNGGRTYQIKGNSITSVAANVSTGVAQVNGKASIQDVTDPLNPISVDGGATLQMNMTDKGEPGSSDTIGFTVWNKSGGLWFSSNWTGVKTAEQLLVGGNLVVH
jgi:hypothetical protein